jgi:hypothetical protein
MYGMYHSLICSILMQSNLFNRSFPMKVVRVCNGMAVDRRALVNAANFGAMLGMKCSKLNPELYRFLTGVLIQWLVC